MRQIPLPQGRVALVDDEDYQWLMQWKWCAGTSGWGYYAKRHGGKSDNSACVYMHRVIVGAQAGQEVDHINHDTLDNRRANLRLCTREQNLQNARKRKGSYTSQYKGVGFKNWARRWVARIQFQKEAIHLGYFDTEAEAAEAYRAAAAKCFGDFAYGGEGE